MKICLPGEIIVASIESTWPGGGRRGAIYTDSYAERDTGSGNFKKIYTSHKEHSYHRFVIEKTKQVQDELFLNVRPLGSSIQDSYSYFFRSEKYHKHWATYNQEIWLKASDCQPYNKEPLCPKCQEACKQTCFLIKVKENI